jgi:glycosyltransferase involved in cell wall biosynthesis
MMPIEESIISSNRPLVSFVLLTYNQEKYVADALRAALNQTYSPLEIIISDDCSQG